MNTSPTLQMALENEIKQAGLKGELEGARSERKKIFAYIEKHYLDYCLKQNGLHYCKNCGLDIDELKEEFKL